MKFAHSPFHHGRPDWARSAVLLLSMVFFVSFTNRAVLGPFLVHMQTSLGLDAAQAASLLSLMSAGMAGGMLFSGVFTSLLAPRRIIALSLTGSGLSMLLVARVGGLGEAMACFALMGMFCGFYMSSAVATLAVLVKPESWSRAISIHELAPSLSVIISPVLAETSSSLLGWRGGMTMVGGLSLLTGLLFLCWKSGGTRKLPRPSVSGAIAAIRRPLFWAFIWMYALAIAGEFAPYSILPLSLTIEQGLDTAEAARLLSLSRFPTPFLVLAGGTAAAYWGARKCLLLFLAVQGVSLFVMALPHSYTGTPGLAIAMAWQAMAAAFAFPALFTLFAEAFPQEQQPMIISLSIPVASFLGNGVTPYLLGLCGKYLTFATGYLIFGLLCLGTVPVLRFCRTSKEGVT